LATSGARGGACCRGAGDTAPRAQPASTAVGRANWPKLDHRTRLDQDTSSSPTVICERGGGGSSPPSDRFPRRTVMRDCLYAGARLPAFLGCAGLDLPPAAAAPDDSSVSAVSKTRNNGPLRFRRVYAPARREQEWWPRGSDRYVPVEGEE